ncbi:MAG: hypothetical protein RIR12_1209 [Bacteroidota bacterium]
MVCAAFSFLNVTAQTNLTNTGQLYLTANTDTVFISGSFINSSSASLFNGAGNLYVKQNLTNHEAAMSAAAGKLWLTGTSLQTVAGTEPFRTYSLALDNNAGVQLQNRIGIGDGSGGTLDFINGVITSGTNSQDVYFYSGSNYSGYTDASHVVGYVSKRGATNFTFPIGNGIVKADLDIASLSTTADFQCKYFEAGYGTYPATAPLISVFAKEFWTLDRTTGTASAQVTLKWNDARKFLNHSVPADLRVGHYTGGAWISEGGTGSGNAAIGSVSSGSISNFSPFTFASEGVVLPLKLISFNASPNEACNVNIKWTVQEETDVAAFHIQRSTDGFQWNDVEIIQVRNPTVNEKAYATTDNVADKSINWRYRLKIVQHNGQSVYSTTNSIKLNCAIAVVKVYPSVTENKVTVENLNVSNPLKSIKLLSENGQLLSQVFLPASINQIDLSTYPSGRYVVTVETKTQKQSVIITRH